MELYEDFKKIVIADIPLVDLRSPAEFEKGAFRGAINLPILTNKQRELVGKKYKSEGNEAATRLGFELTQEDKVEKVAKWVDFLTKNPKAMIYCFRGGQRSQIAQEWIYQETKKVVPRISGGYKAFRKYLIKSLYTKNQNYQAYRLGGLTGVGKTILLHEMDEIIDLEGLANHRGSIFGTRITSQPTQINFENNLAYDLIIQENRGYKFLVFEDEGIHVGRSFLPKEFHQFLSASPLVVLEASFRQRVENIMQEYVYDEQKEYQNKFGKLGLDKWQEYIHTSITKAKSKLGGKRYKESINLVDEAVKLQKKGKNGDAHSTWIERFLSNYYDPMYTFQLEEGSDAIIFRGDKEEVKQFFASKR